MRIYFVFLFSLSILGCSTSAIPSISGSAAPSNGFNILPNGHYLTPAGMTLPLGSLPLGLSISPDRKNIIAVNSGFGDHTLSVINVQQQKIVQTLPIRKSWMGSVWGPYNDYFFVTGGNDNKVYRYGFKNDSAWFINSILLGKPAPEEFVSPTGIDITPDGDVIFTVSRMSNMLFKLNAYENTIERTLLFDSPLYSCIYDEVRQLVYVSEWGRKKISVVQSGELKKVLDISVGDHPSAIAMNPGKTHLFAANAGDNSISVINLSTFRVEETIDIGIRPNSLIGSTPNALAFRGDSLLYVALADNNAIAVVDLHQDHGRAVKGFIPTGWYPTAVIAADSMIIVANGYGTRSYSNLSLDENKVMNDGSISFIPYPTDEQLSRYTSQVRHNNPYTRVRDVKEWNSANPIPQDFGAHSPIKHIFYIIKELRTYDQVFGDIKRGNGVDSLAVYGRNITPNHHALAEEFVLLDNFYANGRTTPDGINAAVSGYANDYIQKTWPTLYGRRGGVYDYEQDGMATSAGGYLWDAALNAGHRVRNYGMFVDETASSRGEIIPKASGLAANTSPIYRGWDLYYPDTLRAEMWMKEFSQYESGDSLPALSIIRLPNDHTAGDSKRHRSRVSYIADNDRALGKIVERISQSKYWETSAIFVLESSAYGGADHKDAHRTVGLVVSPFVKRNSIDHTHYTTTSMLNTIERILSIPFMTQHDAGAEPMYRLFHNAPDIRSFQSKPISPSINHVDQ